MMLIGPPDKRTLQKTFNRVLNEILDGTLSCAPLGNGLDDQTRAALNDLALHRNTQRAVKIIAAYDELARQLDGSHARQAQADVLKLLGP